MDPQHQQLMAFYPYPTPTDAAYGAFPAWAPMGAPMMNFPSTPTTSGMHMFPDTTVKSGSEFGDTPPSSGSSSNQTKRKFKSPEEEKRYRQKRTRNNEAAKKSRKTRKEKEVTLQVENGQLKEHIKALSTKCSMLQDENNHLKARIAALESMSAFNSENINPAQFSNESKAFQGMYPLSMNPQ